MGSGYLSPLGGGSKLKDFDCLLPEVANAGQRIHAGRAEEQVFLCRDFRSTASAPAGGRKAEVSFDFRLLLRKRLPHGSSSSAPHSSLTIMQ